MARLPRVTHTLKVGTSVVAVKLPEVYDNILADVGLAKPAIVPADASHGSISALLRDAQIARIRVSYRNGAGKYRTADIVCDLEKYKTALGTLPGKTYRGFKIIDAFIARRRRLG
jgi:hypothetical protein